MRKPSIMKLGKPWIEKTVIPNFIRSAAYAKVKAVFLQDVYEAKSNN